MIKIIFLLSLGLIIVGCGSEPSRKKDPTTKTIVSEHVANEQESAYFTEVIFTRNSTKLNPNGKRAINFVHQDAKKKGKVGLIQIITWADKEYPDKKDKKLSEEQKKLVDKRNENLKSYIERHIEDVDVKLVSMAERPNVIQELLSTKDARLKKSLEVAGIPKDGKLSPGDPKAGRSIVIFNLETR